jgi:hypothetical protein
MAPWYAWTPWGGEFWVARFLLQRGLALTYLVAFLVAARQFRPLAGEDGLLPLSDYTERVAFREKPSLFYYLDSDRALAAGAWLGVALAALAFLGVPDVLGTPAYALTWAAMWALYLSFVNAGQTFYGYGWESMLCECGFLAIFLGAPDLIAPAVVVYLFRWVEFRNMFGAGLIKLRGDDCWNDLTCLHYHYETQPMPNPVSWFAHRLPGPVHKFGVFTNHVVELAAPLLYFGPPRVAAVAGLATVGFQGWLMVTGNFSFLNFLTIVMAASLFADSVMLGGAEALGLSGVVPPIPGNLAPLSLPHQVALTGLVVLVVALSYYPVRNMLSTRQAMNRAFDPLNLVNTYGAFGSITRTRYEVVVQGPGTPRSPRTPSGRPTPSPGSRPTPGGCPRSGHPTTCGWTGSCGSRRWPPRPAGRRGSSTSVPSCSPPTRRRCRCSTAIPSTATPRGTSGRSGIATSSPTARRSARPAGGGTASASGPITVRYRWTIGVSGARSGGSAGTRPR